jgi:hypothetical protein
LFKFAAMGKQRHSQARLAIERKGCSRQPFHALVDASLLSLHLLAPYASCGDRNGSAVGCRYVSKGERIGESYPMVGSAD